MTQRDIETATRFGFLEWLQSFEAELLKIPDVVKVEYDLDGFHSNIFQVICIIKYDIRTNRDDYWNARSKLQTSVLLTARANDLYKTSDTIEDYGEHFYFVFGCTGAWKQKNTVPAATGNGTDLL